MRYCKYVVIGLIVLAAARCRLASNEIKNSFITVDKSIARSNMTMADSAIWLLEEIHRRRTLNPASAVRAEYMFIVYTRAVRYVDSLGDVMKSRDTSLESIDVPTRLLVNAPAGDTLNKRISSVYLLAYELATDTTQKANIYSILQSGGSAIFDKKWAWNYFHHTPTVGALTILSKFKMDCTSATVICLRDVLKGFPNK